MKIKNKVVNQTFKKIFYLLPLFSIVAFHAEPAHAGLLDDLKNTATSILNGLGGALDTVVTSVGSIFDELGLGWLFNDLLNFLFGTGTCGQAVTGGVGEVMCNVVLSTTMLPGLISAIGYMMGLMLSVIAVIKLKEHVINPDRTPISDSMKRFVAGGALFTIPSVARAAKNLLVGNGNVQSYDQSGGFNGSAHTAGGLDGMIVMLVKDIWQPLQILLASFSYLAGLVFVVIGISRLLKTAQDGPRGPSGVGTIMTFITAGVLFSLDSIMGAFSTSMFSTGDVATYAVLADGTGDTVVDAHIVGVISAVIGFLALIGWISFIRGFFILRDVAEGNGQASLMAATTHMFGGALAVNIGPLMNAVQSTFGLSSFGVIFTT